MMRGAATLDRMMSLQTPILLAIPAEHGRIQIQCVAQQNRSHGPQGEPHQGLRPLGGPSIGEALKEPPPRIRGREPGQPQQARKYWIPPIARQMFKPFGAQGEPLPPGQQHVHGRDLIVRGLRERREHRSQCRAQPDQFNVQSQEDRSRPDRDRMIGKGKPNLGIER